MTYTNAQAYPQVYTSTRTHEPEAQKNPPSHSHQGHTAIFDLVNAANLQQLRPPHRLDSAKRSMLKSLSLHSPQRDDLLIVGTSLQVYRCGLVHEVCDLPITVIKPSHPHQEVLRARLFKKLLVKRKQNGVTNSFSDERLRQAEPERPVRLLRARKTKLRQNKARNSLPKAALKHQRLSIHNAPQSYPRQ